MKRVLIAMLCLLMAAALLNGCGEQQEAEPDASAAGAAEEVMDSTRMDSAAEAAVDTAAAAVEEAAGEAMEEAGGH